MAGATRWSETERRMLRVLATRLGASAGEIARAVERSKGAVEAKAWRMGIGLAASRRALLQRRAEAVLGE